MGIRVKDRAWLIGELMRQKYSYGIAIAGMHGKSTTTAMIGRIFVEAGLDPLILCGAVMPEYDDSVRIPDQQPTADNQEPTNGKPLYIIAEACEYNKQFLKFSPKAAVILNIDKEHLDTYPRGMPQIIRAFRDFIKLIPSNGLVIINKNDRNLMNMAKSARCQVKYYGEEKLWPGLKLQLIGDFNRLNATAAAHVAHAIGIDTATIKRALNGFSGIARRSELKGEVKGVPVYDDYGHHPTEIQATLNAFKEKFSTRSIIAVFQPHQFIRTKALLPEFKKVFANAQKVYIASIYEVAGRDNPHIISTQSFAEAISHPNIEVIEESYQKIAQKIFDQLTTDQLIITMGATPIYEVADYLVKMR
jgi:UDP-N-acetylmuramate--alanine ligase